MTWDDRELEAWCKRMPKVELHAHIHGSIRATTLQELLADEARRHGQEPRRLPPYRSLNECFDVFSLIHQVVVSRETLRRITIEAIEDFARENVKYLELRSTPRALARDGATRWDYVAEVVAALEECDARQDLDIQVRFLLSINRNQSVELAEDTVAMAVEWQQKSRFVVGVDLSGQSDRADSEFHRFQDVLERARQQGLQLAVHYAEHFDDAEAELIMAFRPDRLGHACCLSPEHYEQLIKLRIPIEVCLTSNIHTLAKYRKEDCGCDGKDVNGLCVCAYREHPHRRIVTSGTTMSGSSSSVPYPLCLCTDDHGVFDTTLSREYARAALAFGLSKARIVALARGALPLIFDPTVRPALNAAFKGFEGQM